MNITPRYKKFMEEYAKSSNITQSAITAGFSPLYADKQGKLILNRAIKYHTQSLLNKSKDNEITAKEINNDICELLGISREMVFNRIKHIAFEQTRDYGASLKALQPVSKSLGYNIGSDEQPNTTPSILNVIVDSNNMANNKDIVEGEIVK